MSDFKYLVLILRYNATPSAVKSLITRRANEQKRFICDMFDRNKVESDSIESVHILDKPFQPYTTFVEFKVTMKPTMRPSQIWDEILRKWSSPDIWLSPLDSEVISGCPFQPQTSMETDMLSFSFGTILDGYKYIRYTQQFSEDSIENPVVSFSFSRNNLYVYFVAGDIVSRLYCIEFSWMRDLEKRIIVCDDGNVVRFYMQLYLLPKLHQAEPFKRGNTTVQRCSPTDYFIGDNYFSWLRKAMFPSSRKEIIGNCTAIELVINRHNNYKDILMYMKRFGVEISYCQMKQDQPVARTVWQDLYKMSEKYFDVYWAFKTLHSRGFWVIETIEREPEFKTQISKYMHDGRSRMKLLQALNDLASLSESERYINLLKAFENYLSFEYKAPMIEYKGLEYVRGIVVTPLRIIFYPTMPVQSNRVIREYNVDYCVRVTYRDEDMDRLKGGSTELYDSVVFDHISRPMQVCDRVYNFLACSNSQLRSAGVWFYAQDSSGITAELIRSEMGDLSQIKNVASLVSRMGQCFTTTHKGVKIEAEWMHVIDDVEANGYCFSDGTGLISVELRDEVAKTLGHRPHSLYQIRYGGCKGTLALDPSLEGKQILIRKSMKKFDSYHTDLEICEEADARRLYLNHSAVMLMEQLGVPKHIFLGIQERALFELLDMMLFEERAARMIDHRTIPNIKFTPLVDQGVGLITDPFIRKILLLVLYKTVDVIKTNSRIELPLDYARNLMGTMDMTNTLEYGEVFIQYSTDLQKKGEIMRILESDVIITKFPANHVGDMRRFVARDVPALRHMFDCIVFPAKGPRPHADEMSGSDLDGDEFFVTWLPEFLDTFQRENQEAMDYSFVKRNALVKPVEFRDTFRYITDYIQNDNLGRISNALKVAADSEPDGYFSLKCRELAKKAAMAVDFPKTQVPVTLTQQENVLKYPDFMGKQGRNWVYNSKRVLGKMFQVCSNLTDIVEGCLINDKGYTKVTVMPDIVIPESIVKQASDAYNLYVNGLSEMMHSYGIKSEEELISGKIRSLHKRLHDKEELFSTEKILRLMVTQYRQHFRSRFFKELGINEEPEKLVITEAMRVKAISWYNCVYKQPHPESNYLSFPWIVADIIGDIVNTNESQIQSSTDRITESMTKVYFKLREKTTVVNLSTNNPQMLEFENAEESPAMVVLWMFICLWAQKQAMDFDYVRKLMDRFISRRYNVNIPQLPPKVYRKFAVLMAYVTRANVRTAQIRGETIGQVILAFLRYHGSQDSLAAVDQRDGLNAMLKASYLHEKSLKAYFHLALFNDCEELLSSQVRIFNQSSDNTKNVIIPANVWAEIRTQLDVVKSDIRKVFKGLTNVSITRHKGKKQTGTLFAVGFFDDVNTLERVLNSWFSVFQSQRSYETDFKNLKEQLT